MIGQEDCLLLNVYVPETAIDNPDDKLPVMFWIHGGSLTAGSNIYEQFGPKHLVEKNVITVHVNYRLGPLGSMLTVFEFLGAQRSEYVGPKKTYNLLYNFIIPSGQISM